MKASILNNKLDNGSFVKRSGWLFLAKLIPTLTFLVITIFYSRQISFNDYGVFQSVYMLTNISVVFFGFGTYSVLLFSGLHSLLRLLRSNRMLFISFYILLFLLIVGIIFTSLYSHSLSLKVLILSMIVINTVSFLFESILVRAKKESSIFSINLFYAFLYFVWHYYLVLRDFNIEYLVSGVLILGIVRLVTYLVLFHKTVQEKNVISITLQHWFFIGMNEVIGAVAKWLDKLLLVYFITPAEFGIFFNGSFEIPIFGILISVVGSLLLVEVSANLLNKEKVIQQFQETFLLLSNFVFPLFWFLFFFSEEIFHVLFNNRYNASIAIFSLTILIIPVRVTHYSAILQCYNKAHYILKGSLLDIFIAIMLMPLLYYFIGLKGVALAIVISTYFQSYYYLYHSAKVLQTTIDKLVPFKMLVFRFIVFALLLGVFCYLIQDYDDLFILIYSTIFLSVIILCSLYYYFSNSKLQLNKLSSYTRKEN